MNRDNQLMLEAMHHHGADRIITSELHKVHTILNQLSTMIHLNRSAETDQLLSKIRDMSEMLMTDAPAEDAEGASDQEYHGMRKDALAGAGEELGDGPIKLQLLADEKLDCYKAGAVQSVRFAKGTIFNCVDAQSDFYHCETEEYGTIAVFPEHMKRLDRAEDAEHRSPAQHAAIAISLQKAGKKPS